MKNTLKVFSKAKIDDGEKMGGECYPSDFVHIWGSNFQSSWKNGFCRFVLRKLMQIIPVEQNAN